MLTYLKSPGARDRVLVARTILLKKNSGDAPSNRAEKLLTTSLCCLKKPEPSISRLSLGWDFRIVPLEERAYPQDRMLNG